MKDDQVWTATTRGIMCSFAVMRSVHELKPADILITDEPRIWPRDRNNLKCRVSRATTPGGTIQVSQFQFARRDQMVLRVMFPSVKPRLSARTQTFFWKGPLQLVGGSEVLVRVVEVGEDDGLLYYPRVSPASKDVAELSDTPFASASEALRAVELRLNGAIHESVIESKGQSSMEVLTLYVGQGNFAIVRHGRQAIAVDTRWLSDRSDEIESTVDRFLRRRELVGVVLTGLDDDHADPAGLEWLLGDADSCVGDVSQVLQGHRQRPTCIQHNSQARATGETTHRTRSRDVSVRLDRLNSRYFDDLSEDFQLELFSPHIDDMDNSNNCSIVLKIEGIGPGGFAYLVTGDTENPAMGPHRGTIRRCLGRRRAGRTPSWV